MSKPSARTGSRRRGAAALVLLAVALLHGLALEAALGSAEPGRVRSAASPAVAWRLADKAPMVARNPHTSDRTPAQPPATPPAMAPARVSTRPSPAARHRTVAAIAADASPAAARPAGPQAPSPRAARALADPPDEDAPSPAAAPDVPGDPPPVYAAEPVPSRSLRYDVRQGADHGSGTLDWRLDGSAYEAALAIRLDNGKPLLTWSSRGAVDGHGVAPQQSVERRRRRGPRGVSFERDAAVVRFEHDGRGAVLHAGAQDRLSWIAQLAAIARADAEQLAPGRQVRLQVAMAAGVADVWAFDVLGSEADGLHLHRSAQRPFDTELDVWLDPEADYWPRRLVQGFPPSPLKLELRRADERS